MADVDADQEFEQVGAGAAESVPAQASSIRKNGHIIIKGRPCKVVEMSTSKTGKHGHAKIHFVALDIFTNKKYEDIVPSTHNTMIPNVKRTEYQLLDIDDGFLSLMSDSGDTREDIKVPDTDVGEEIKKRIETDVPSLVTILSAMGEEAAISVKNMSK